MLRALTNSQLVCLGILEAAKEEFGAAKVAVFFDQGEWWIEVNSVLYNVVERESEEGTWFFDFDRMLSAGSA